MKIRFIPCLFTLQSLVYCQTTYINSQEEASSLTDYPTITGSLVIPSGVVGSIDLRGVQRVDGDIRCENGLLTSLSSDTLATVGGRIVISNLTRLKTLSFSKLRQTKGLQLSNIPLLTEISFMSGLSTVSELRIRSTSLKSIGNVIPTYMEWLDIQYCQNLTDLFLTLNNLNGSILLYKNTALRTVSLGNFPTASSVNVAGNFTSFHGFENLKSVDDFNMENDARYDCAQYSRYESGSIYCYSPNSTYSKVHSSPATPSSSATRSNSASSSSSLLSNTKFSVSSTTSQSQTNPTSTSRSTANSTLFDPTINTPEKLSVPSITAIILVPLFCFAIITCLFIRHRRNQNSKMAEGSENSRVAELPLGGYSEKVELPTVERPGQLQAVDKTLLLHQTVELPADAIISSKKNLHGSSGGAPEKYQVFCVDEGRAGLPSSVAARAS